MPHDEPADNLAVIEAMKLRLEVVSDGQIGPESIARHCDNLARLAENLRKLGMDDKAVNAQVVGIFQQYERALVQGIIDAQRLG